MNKSYELSAAWGAAIAGSILLVLPVAGAFYRGSLGWVDVVVALIGVAGLAVATEGFIRVAVPR